MMSAPKYTPGPWQSFAGKAMVGVARNAGTDVRLIAEMNRGLPEAEANARLMASAPDMLRVLRLTLGALSADCAATRDLVERVIAQAEGRTS